MLRSLSLLALVTATSSVLAQHRAETVVVTASRINENQADVLGAIDVIDREQIDRSGSVDVLDLLRAVAGIDIVRGGGLGQQASVFIRGTNSNHALVLIDGVRVSALGTGAYAWEHLPIAQIERIEIVRGPRASLWGADALGGVLQIFTRRAEGSDMSLKVGNHDTYGVEAGTGRRGERGGFSARLGWLDSRGQNATRPGNFSFDPDRDGAMVRNASVAADLELGQQKLAFSALHTDDEIDFDQGVSRTRQDVQSLTLSGELSDHWLHQLVLGAGRDRLDTPAFTTAYRSRRQQADWLHTVSRGASTATFGLGWLHERGAQFDTWGAGSTVYQQSRHTSSGFGRWQYRLAQHTLEASGRYDDNSVYGGESSLAADWAWDITSAVRVSASWGEGFRAPTMNELFSPGWGGWYAGNPELEAERARNVELAARLDAESAGAFELRAFRNTIDQLIDFSGPQAQAINIARAHVEGVELGWLWQAGAWSVDSNATWQQPRNRDTGEALLRRPARKANLLIERGFDSGLRVGVEATAASARPDYAGTTLAGYGLLAVRAYLPLSEAWGLDTRVDNILNRDYTLVDGYHTPGTTALLSLRWRGD